MTPVDDKVLWVENCWLGYFISFSLILHNGNHCIVLSGKCNSCVSRSRFQAYGGFLFRTRSNTQIHNTHAWFQTSAAKQMRTALIWIITRVVVNSYRHFGTTYRVPNSGSLNFGPIGCPETSRRNCHYSLCNNPEGGSSHTMHRVPACHLSTYVVGIC
jgi:hypothetical protein